MVVVLEEGSRMDGEGRWGYFEEGMDMVYGVPEYEDGMGWS